MPYTQHKLDEQGHIVSDVHGPTKFHVVDGRYIHGPDGDTGYYIEDSHIYGPHGGWYLSEGYIYGETEELPWLIKDEESAEA